MLAGGGGVAVAAGALEATSEATGACGKGFAVDGTATRAELATTAEADSRGGTAALGAGARSAGVGLTARRVEPLRFHDLRSTFCTWARRAEKSDARIMERTGQEIDGGMISRYDRGAQTLLADLAHVPLPDITHAIPELVSPAPLATERIPDVEPQELLAAIPLAYIVGARGFEPPTPRSRTGAQPPEGRETPSQTGAAEDTSRPLDAPKCATGQRVGQGVDPVDATLAKALGDAAAAGRFDVVAQLARELEARRLAASPNVVALPARRGRS